MDPQSVGCVLNCLLYGHLHSCRGKAKDPEYISKREKRRKYEFKFGIVSQSWGFCSGA